MVISQLSVFLENKSGRLAEVLEVLGNEDLRITALSVADTNEFGILRLIVSDTDKARVALREHNFTVNVTEVISVMVPDQARHYAKVLKVLSDINISVEYTYGFPHGKEAVIVLRCSNNEEAVKALENKNIELLSAKDFKDF